MDSTGSGLPLVCVCVRRGRRPGEEEREGHIELQHPQMSQGTKLCDVFRKRHQDEETERRGGDVGGEENEFT